MRKIIATLSCLILGLCMFGCGDKTDTTPKVEPVEYTMKLSLTSDPNPTIALGETYKLKYSLSVGVREDVVPAAIEGEDFAGGTFDNVTNMYRPDREGKALLRLTATYHGKSEARDVVVTVTGGNAGENPGETGGDRPVVTRADYPSDPEYNRLQARPNDFTTWTEFGTHDPSLIQVDDVYYAFSTDVDQTTKGYQIRKSLDGMHWNYIGAAFADPPTDVAPAVKYLGLSDDFSFWAPDIVKGTDGQFWLYYSITSAFGSSKSYIGLAKASDILGPYKHAGMVVCSTTDRGMPNAIDPQVVIDGNGDYWLSWGSFMRGIYIMRLDNETGLPLRTPEILAAYAAGANTIAGTTADVSNDFVSANRAQAVAEGVDVGTYFDGTNKNYVCGYYIGSGRGTGMEGSVIARHTDATSATGERYYLFVSYGDLTKTYNMRCFTSEHVYGPYVDAAGNQPYYASESTTGENNSGNKVMGSFRFAMNDGSAANDFYAPGHNDLFTTNDGVDLVAYHCRCTQVGDNMHYLYTSQYYFNSEGDLVVNPNRWAGETLRAITVDELLGKSGALASALAAEQYDGAYKMVQLRKTSTAIVESKLVHLTDDGKIMDGSNEVGAYTLHGDYFVTVTLGAEQYEGVVSPAWLTEQNLPGLTMTLVQKETGEALYFNMARK